MSLQALSGQQYDEEAQQSVSKSASESHGQTDLSPSASVILGPAGLHAVSPAAIPAAAAYQAASVDASANDASENVQQHTAASTEGVVAGGSYDMAQHAAASVHATVLEEDFPGSDADTDLSSVGLRPGRLQSAQGKSLHLWQLLQFENGCGYVMFWL